MTFKNGLYETRTSRGHIEKLFTNDPMKLVTNFNVWRYIGISTDHPKETSASLLVKYEDGHRQSCDWNRIIDRPTAKHSSTVGGM